MASTENRTPSESASSSEARPGASDLAEARMRSLAEASPDFVVLVDCDGRIEYMNRTNGRVAVDRYVGTDICDLLRDASAVALRECMDRVRATGKVDQCEIEYQDWEDEVRYFVVRVGPVLREGQVVAFALNARDVTGAKLAGARPAPESPRQREDAAAVSPGADGGGRPIEVRFEQRLDFEELLSDLSGEFACVPSVDNLDRLIDQVLMKTARFLKAQRALMLQWMPDHDVPQCTHEWHEEHVTPVMHLLTHHGFQHYAWLLQKLREGVPFVVRSVRQLPDEARRERATMTAQGVCSLAVFPLTSDDKLLGAIGFSSIGVERHWPEESIARLRVISGLVANAMVRKQTDSALRRAHDGLQHVTASVSAGLWSVRVAVDGQWQDHYLSPVMRTITGQSSASFGNCLDQWLASVCADDRQHVREVMEHLARCAPTHDEIEYRIRLTDGTTRWIRNSTNARRLPSGDLRLDGIVTDITDRRQAEAALQESEALFRQLAEHLEGAVWLKDLATPRMLYVSPSFEAIFGCSHQTLLDAPHSRWERLHPDDRPRVEESFRLTAELGGYDEEFRVVRDNGELVWIRDRAFPIHDDDGRVYRLAGISEDITQRKLADEQLRHHQEELVHAGRLSTMGELVASIAHEINQPLHAISNYAGACQNSLDQPTEASLARLANWAREIQVQAKRAGTIIARLGDFVRKAPPHRSTLNVNELIIDSIDLLRFEARSYHVRVGLDLATPIPLVLADRVQIQQVVVNLVRNAFDALGFVEPSSRRVAITVENGDHQVSVHVADCGKGLPAQGQSRVFEPFFTTKEDGMGMGLAISRSIIEAHGGRLWSTENQEAGATFHFQLPAQTG